MFFNFFTRVLSHVLLPLKEEAFLLLVVLHRNTKLANEIVEVGFSERKFGLIFF